MRTPEESLSAAFSEFRDSVRRALLAFRAPGDYGPASARVTHPLLSDTEASISWSSSRPIMLALTWPGRSDISHGPVGNVSTEQELSLDMMVKRGPEDLVLCWYSFFDRLAGHGVDVIGMANDAVARLVMDS